MSLLFKLLESTDKKVSEAAWAMLARLPIYDDEAPIPSPLPSNLYRLRYCLYLLDHQGAVTHASLNLNSLL
jgi:hypothetical protein